MTPISLGIFASANQSAAATSYESIATTTVGSGGTATITFSSIPATYTHLQIRGIVRSAKTSVGEDIVIPTLNSDSTTSNYVKHGLYGTGTSAAAFGYTSDRGFDGVIRDNATASTYSVFVVDILDYANTNKYKTLRALGGYDANGSGLSILTSNLWLSTSAITSISLALIANNFVQYTQFALYGIKGAA